MAKESKWINKVSPRGKAKWAWLSKPDEKFGKNDYRISLILTPEEAQKTVYGITNLAQEVYDNSLSELKPAKRKSLKLGLPFKDEVDDEGQETGNIEFMFSSKNKPGLFDSVGDPIKGDLIVGNGSTIRVSYSFPKDGYLAVGFGYAGIKLYLKNVQIIDLCGYSSGDEFEDEDGSYSGSDANSMGENEDMDDGEGDF